MILSKAKGLNSLSITALRHTVINHSLIEIQNEVKHLFITIGSADGR